MYPLSYLLPLAAYLYGAVPFGFLAAKFIKNVDIRQTGSGNIGATNAARVLGWKFFPMVFLLDFSKGLLPTGGALWIETGGHPLVVATALAAILGHVFPVYLGFKGGKAVATGTGAFAVLMPYPTLMAAGIWAVVFAIWRYVSLASMCATAALVASYLTLSDQPFGDAIFLTAFCLVGAGLVIALHHSNIKRLLRGTEHKIGAAHPQKAEETKQEG